MPIVFGPNYLKFAEAVGMVKLGIAFPVENAAELTTIFDQMLSDKETREAVSQKCSTFTNQNLGATQIILSKVFNKEIKS